MSEEFKSLLTDFEQLRMPLEKYEIARDKSLPGPLPMKRYPPNNDETDEYISTTQKTPAVTISCLAAFRLADR